MSYQVLARKYRPQTFEEVVGQKPIITTLQNAVEQKRLHHAYLFSGLRGVGKTTVARLVAKALNCAQGPTPRPCNACPSCTEIAQSRSLDVMEIDGASNRGIDDVRELRETVRYAPARDRYKVYIIDEVHMLTEAAWNALLKTLEEPPPHVVFVFATTDYRKIPLTILSRCQHFEFRKIAEAEMLAHLRRVAEGESVKTEPGALELVARMAEGSLRDAQSAFDQVIAFCGRTVTEEQARTILGVVDRELITGFYAAVRAQDCPRLVEIVDTVFERGYQPVHFLEDLMAHGRNLLLARVLPDPASALSGGVEEIRAAAREAEAFSEDELLRLLELMTREEARLKSSGHPRFLLEALAIKLARLADLRPIEEMIAALDRPGGAPADPDPPAPPRLTPALRVGKVWIDSLEDILANKIGCLVSRSEMKDYVDLYYLIPASGLSTGQIIELGTKKEAGLDPLILAHQIDFIFLEKAPPAELVVKADRQKIQLFFKKLQQECFDLIRP